VLIASESVLTLKIIKDRLNTGNWDIAPGLFKVLKDELYQKRGIVVPEATRPHIFQLAHEKHHGITKVE